MFSSSPETLILRPPNLRTNSSSLSRTSPLTNTGLRSSILGTWRKAFRYSSRESFLCLLLIRREIRERLPLLRLTVPGSRMWCRSVLPSLLTSLFLYHSRMIPCSLNAAIWREYERHVRTCHSLPFFFGQFLFCYHTFLILIGLLTGPGAHLDSLSWAKEMCIVNRIKRMEIPWQLCNLVHYTDWASVLPAVICRSDFSIPDCSSRFCL